MYGLIIGLVVRAIVAAARSQSEPPPQSRFAPPEPRERDDWPRLAPDPRARLWQTPHEESARLPDLQAWAARQLEEPPDAPPEVARTAFLKHLADEEFVPPLPVQLGWSVYAGTPEAAVHRAVAEETEDRLAEEVADFVARFNAVSAEERQRRWRELAAACQPYARLTARLTDLSPRIAAGDLPHDKNPAVSRLIEHLDELSLLPRTSRAIRRRELLVGIYKERFLWAAAARIVKKYPALAACDPTFLAQISRWNTRFRPVILAVGSSFLAFCVIVPLNLYTERQRTARPSTIEPSRFPRATPKEVQPPGQLPAWRPPLDQDNFDKNDAEPPPEVQTPRPDDKGATKPGPFDRPARF